MRSRSSAPRAAPRRSPTRASRGSTPPRSVPAAPMPRDAGAVAGVEMLRGGRIEEALAALSAAAERSPSDAVVRYQLARALQAAGRTAEAIAALTRVLAEGSPSQRTLQGWTMIRLAAALSEMGRGEEAAGHLRRAAEIKGFPFARAAEDRLRHPEEKNLPEG